MPFLEEQYEFARAIANENVEDFHGEQAHIFTNPALNECISQVIQNTRKDFLRSEIERVELEANEDGTHHSECPLSHINLEVSSCVCGAIHSGKQQALTSIITRYKEELKVLEKANE